MAGEAASLELPGASVVQLHDNTAQFGLTLVNLGTAPPPPSPHPALSLPTPSPPPRLLQPFLSTDLNFIFRSVFLSLPCPTQKQVNDLFSEKLVVFVLGI